MTDREGFLAFDFPAWTHVRLVTEGHEIQYGWMIPDSVRQMTVTAAPYGAVALKVRPAEGQKLPDKVKDAKKIESLDKVPGQLYTFEMDLSNRFAQRGGVVPKKDATYYCVFATFAREAAWVIQRLREMGRTYIYVGSDVLGESDFLETAGTNANGVYAPSAVIFDAGRRSFRNDIYPAYKAHRPEPPPELVPQFALVREATRAFNVPAIEQPGYEADDLIATYARLARGLHRGVSIFTRLGNACAALAESARKP